MSFQGVDWTELSKYFGIIGEGFQGDNEEVILEKTREYLYSSFHTDRESEVAYVVRLFLQKLYENSKGIKENAPVWKGLLEIEGDFTFIKYSGILLEYMWY